MRHLHQYFLLVILMMMTSAENNSFSAPRQRLAPPTGLPCSRDTLTSYSGKILRYTRQPKQIFLLMRTDEATTEKFQIEISKGKNHLNLFLLNGQTISATELDQVEKKILKKSKAVTVTVWECINTRHRVIDWRAELN
jgi:hypothetical protein